MGRRRAAARLPRRDRRACRRSWSPLACARRGRVAAILRPGGAGARSPAAPPSPCSRSLVVAARAPRGRPGGATGRPARHVPRHRPGRRDAHPGRGGTSVLVDTGPPDGGDRRAAAPRRRRRLDLARRDPRAGRPRRRRGGGAARDAGRALLDGRDGVRDPLGLRMARRGRRAAPCRSPRPRPGRRCARGGSSCACSRRRARAPGAHAGADPNDRAIVARGCASGASECC